MFEPVPDLSSDLEWMLQSGQASREMLAEALLEEYYAPVYRLALSVLGNGEAAQTAARETFSAALLEVYRYQSSRGVKAWLFARAAAVLGGRTSPSRSLRSLFRRLRPGPRTVLPVEGASSPAPLESATAGGSEEAVSRAWGHLPVRQRMVAALHWLLGWQPAEIAQALKMRPTEVESRLGQLGSRFVAELGHRGPGVQLEDLDSTLAEAMDGLWPPLQVSEFALQARAAELAAQVSRKGATRQRFNYIQEMLVVGLVILTVAGVVAGSNLMAPDEEKAPAQTVVRTVLVTRSHRLQAAAGAESTPDLNGTPINPTPLAPTPFPEDALYTIRQGDNLEQVAEQLGVGSQELAALNRIPEGGELIPGQRLLIPGRLPVAGLPTPTPISPSARPAPMKPPYTASTLRRLLAQSQYSTRWQDVTLFDYGPAGYAGPPQAYRFQFWMSESGFLLLGGEPNGPVEEVFLATQREGYGAQPGAGNPWFVNLGRDSDFESFFSPRFNASLDLLANAFRFDRFPAVAAFTIVGNEPLLGQNTLVVEMSNSGGRVDARMWVDIETGLVLQSQEFSAADPQTMQTQLKMNAFQVDINFPAELFDPRLPWRGGFASDATGQPVAAGAAALELPEGAGHAQVALPVQAPADFDPSHSRLTFQFAEDYRPSAVGGRAEVFAGDTALGVVELFGNPWSMACDRSPDGRRIAFVSQPGNPAGPATELRWFDLANTVGPVRSGLKGVSISQLAFAPDNYRLAAFGKTRAAGGLYVVDTETGGFYRLLRLIDARSIVWSPDGQFIGLIGRSTDPQAGFREDVMVVRADTGQVTYRQSIDFETGNESAGWPMIEWGIDFPVEMGGLAACAAPPQPIE